MYSVATPPIKLKVAQQTGRGLLKSKPPGPIIMMCQSENTEHQLDHILLHSFLQVHGTAAAFTSHGNHCNYAEPKPFS
jgi:hypothetical protein